MTDTATCSPEPKTNALDWPWILRSRANASYLKDTEGTVDLLRKTADYIETALSAQAESDDCICIACAKPLNAGDMVLLDISEGGLIHAECCGPERDSYCDADGEPLADDAPIPTPFPYDDGRKDTAHPHPVETVKADVQPVAEVTPVALADISTILREKANAAFIKDDGTYDDLSKASHAVDVARETIAQLEGERDRARDALNHVFQQKDELLKDLNQATIRAETAEASLAELKMDRDEHKKKFENIRDEEIRSRRIYLLDTERLQTALADSQREKERLREVIFDNIAAINEAKQLNTNLHERSEQLEESLEGYQKAELPVIHATFEISDNNVTGSTNASVKRVEANDDGSFTVVIDHWPDTSVSFAVTDEMIKRYRSTFKKIWPGSGWPDRDTTVVLLTAALNSEGA